MKDVITVREQYDGEKMVYELRKNKKAIGAARADTRSDHVSLDSIFVKEELRNMGYGSILLNYIEKANWNKDYVILMVDVLSPDYAKILHFYEKNGYSMQDFMFMKKNLKKGIDRKHS